MTNEKAIDQLILTGVELRANLKLALLFGQLRRDAPHRIISKNTDAYIIEMTHDAAAPAP
jgi:hypothetical protein